MNINLSLKNHCIETEIRRQHQRAVSDYFKAGGTGDLKALERRIEILHHALENLDFGYLRNRYADLRGDSDADVLIGEDESGHLNIQINGEKIYATN